MNAPPSVTNGHDVNEQLRLLEEAHFEVLQLEERLKIAKENLRTLKERDVPDALFAAGLTRALTPGGFHVRLGDEVHVNMPPIKDRGEMIAWCVAHGHIHLVKKTYTIDFPKGKWNEAAEFAGRCAKVLSKDFPFTKLESEQAIHGSTLKSFTEKALRAGVELPEFFGYYAPRAAIIEIPKPVEADSGQLEAQLVASLKTPD